MCLYCKDSKLKVAEEDIVCFKVVTFDFVVGCYRPFFQFKNHWIPIGVINGLEPYVPEGDAVPECDELLCEYAWGRGLVHAYKNRFEGGASCLVGPYVNIYRCVIPKGVEYVEGEDDAGCPCYAAKRLVFGERVYGKDYHMKFGVSR